MQVLLHTSFGYCVIRRTYVLFELILKLSAEFEIMLPTLLFACNKTFTAPNGEFERFGGFALTV